MIMTNDEFCIAGIDNAELAASPDIELEQASSYLKRAIYCFDKAQSSELVAKANAHLDSVQLRAKYAQAKSFTHNELEAVVTRFVYFNVGIRIGIIAPYIYSEKICTVGRLDWYLIAL